MRAQALATAQCNQRRGTCIRSRAAQVPVGSPLDIGYLYNKPPSDGFTGIDAFRGGLNAHVMTKVLELDLGFGLPPVVITNNDPWKISLAGVLEAHYHMLRDLGVLERGG
ncbi:MAG TPA: hypothetical protein VN757_03530 [Steroidobacteraceae bacterium]|nr:hypothetical protein [Steroidobacteraceae bacterium]